MKNAVKIVGMILGALVLGGFIGWVFNMAGYETPITVAIIVVLFTAIDSAMKKARNKAE